MDYSGVLDGLSCAYGCIVVEILELLYTGEVYRFITDHGKPKFNDWTDGILKAKT